MTCHNCYTSCKKFGYNRNRTPRYRCQQCGKTYTDAPTKALEVRIPEETGLRVLSCLVEGNSVNSTCRIVGVNKRTALNILRQAGQTCERVFEKLVARVSPSFVQVDEIWGYVGMKEKHKKAVMCTDPEMGDHYTFVGIDSDTKLILSWEIGKRDGATTCRFMDKLRTVTDGAPRFQLTTDAFRPYIPVIDACWGSNIDYARLIKQYSLPSGQREAQARYSPGEVTHTIKEPVTGHPKLSKISTSHIERQNLTMRMCLRRLTRLTNGFSKKLENLRAAISLHFAWYNFVRVHQTLKTTPAVKAGLTDHVWTMREMLTA